MKALFESWRNFVNQDTVNEQLPGLDFTSTDAKIDYRGPSSEDSTTSSSKAAPGSSRSLEILRTIIEEVDLSQIMIEVLEETGMDINQTENSAMDLLLKEDIQEKIIKMLQNL